MTSSSISGITSLLFIFGREATTYNSNALAEAKISGTKAIRHMMSMASRSSLDPFLRQEMLFFLLTGDGLNSRDWRATYNAEVSLDAEFHQCFFRDIHFDVSQFISFSRFEIGCNVIKEN